MYQSEQLKFIKAQGVLHMQVYYVDMQNNLPDDINLSHDYSRLPKATLDFCEKSFNNGLSQFGYLYINSFDLNNLDKSNPFLREIIFEFVRQIEFPNKVSRFEAIFASKTEEGAKQWFQILKKLYKKSQVDVNPKLCILECVSCFEADVAWRDSLNLKCLDIGTCYYNACQYWLGKKTIMPLMEAIVPLPAKVIARKPIE